MKAPTLAPRAPSELPARLQQQLKNYALAASAAGVSAFALAQPAEGKVIYTPAHVMIAMGHNWGTYNYSLDLNHDGVIDFTIRMFRSVSSSAPRIGTALGILGASENRAAGHPTRPGYDGIAYALRSGRRIGPKIRFGPYNYEVMAVRTSFYKTHETVYCGGRWANVTKRYLGLRFAIKGQVHYGWARMNVSCTQKGDVVGLSGFLTGYAYETIPGKPIIAGKTHGNDAPAASHPVSLGALAAGASAISARYSTKREAFMERP